MNISDELWPKLAAVLGVEDLTARKVIITFEPNKTVIMNIEVELFMEDDDFVTEFKSYKLVEIDDASQ